MADDGINEQYPPAKWEVGGKTITFPVISIDELHDNRLVPHERMYRSGARHDDTGGKAKGWQITSEFYNGCEEPGVPENLYPDTVNDLCDSFDVHETGTLTVPTRGPRRCRAASYRRSESSEERDHARVTFIWAEDNEDDEAVTDWHAPKAASAARAEAVQAADAAAEQGCWDDDLDSLAGLADALESYAYAPINYLGDLESQANKMRSAVKRVNDAFTNASREAQDEVRALMTDPESSRVLRHMQALQDMAAKAPIDKGTTVKQTTPRTYPRQMSIFEIATDVDQDAAELMFLNAAIGDLLNIPPGTVVLVFEG